MRKGLLIAALLGSTALVPARADAGPVLGFIQGVVSFLTTGAAVGAGIGGAFAAGSATAAFFSGTFGSLLLSVGFSALSAALAPRPQSIDPGDRLVNYAQDIRYMERIYGRVRNGGTLGLSVFRNDRRHYIVLLAAHPIQGVVEHYLDDDLVEIDGAGLVTTAPIGFDGGSRGAIRVYTGGPGQAADPILLADVPEWTSAHDFAGLSYAALYARRMTGGGFSDVYTRGDIWTYAPVIEGHSRIWDPRDETFKYTRNAALIIAHEIVDTLGGAVDWGRVAVEADICDQLVTNADGGTQPRWTINTLFSDDQDWDTVRALLLLACDGFMFEAQGGVIDFFVGRWLEPDLILTDADFFALNVTEGLEIGTADQFVAQYVEPANSYRKTPSGTVIADPAGGGVKREVPMFAVDNHDQAVRLLRRTAAVDRARYRLQGTLKLSGRYLVGRRFARLESAELGLSIMIEVEKLTLNDDGATYSLEARSTAAADFAFDAATQTPQRPVYLTPVAENAVPDVTGLTGAAGETAGVASILYEWPMQDSSLRQEIRLRSVDGGQPDWQAYLIGEDQASFLAPALTDGATYEAQIRNRTNAGRLSAWKPDTPLAVVAIANTTPPAAVTGFALTEIGTDAALEWMAPDDANYYAARVYRADYAAAYAGPFDIGDADVVRLEFGLPGNADGWTDPGLTVGVYAYWIEPINRSGLPGTASGPETTEIT